MKHISYMKYTNLYLALYLACFDKLSKYENINNDQFTFLGATFSAFCLWGLRNKIQKYFARVCQ